MTEVATRSCSKRSLDRHAARAATIHSTLKNSATFTLFFSVIMSSARLACRNGTLTKSICHHAHF